MRVAERHTVLDEPFGDVGGEGETGRGFGFEAFLVEDHGGDHAGECRQQHFKRVHLVEYGFLVFLQVARVAVGRPFKVASRPVRSPMSRPDLPRVSSAMSGFFFCGMMDEPVE